MNRRDFLKAIATVPAAALVPAWVHPLPQWGVGIAWRMRLEQQVINDAWTAFLHPSCWFDLRRLVAMDLWRTEYRDWRRRRNAGAAEPIEELMRRVKASVESSDVLGMRESLTTSMRRGEVGSYESVRLIVSDTVHT